MSTITLNNDLMQTLVAKTFLESLTAEQKEKVLLDAVAYLVRPSDAKDRYGNRIDGPSPFQEAFNSMAYRVAREHAEERIKSDEKFKQAVKEIFDKAVEKLFEQSFANQMAEKIAAQVCEGLRASRDY